MNHGSPGVENEKPDGEAAGSASVANQGRAPRAPRYDSLTAWRGVACLLVVLYHSTRHPPQGDGGFAAAIFAFLDKGWLGVPLFFVISGYCVTASADALRWRPRPAGHFFWRRFRRIYPPYWAALAIAALSACLMDVIVSGNVWQALKLPELTYWQWLGNLSLTETWRWHLTGGAESALLPPSWTLCYEEQFYFLVGLVLVLTRRHFFFVLGALTLIVALLHLFPWPGLRTEGLFLDGQWLMFASGVLVYYVANYILPRWWVWSCLPLVVGIAYAAAGPGQLQQSVSQSYVAAFTFALLILGLKRWDDYLKGRALLSPLRRCGEISYSLYLVHWPVAGVVGHGMDTLGLNSPAAILLFRIPACVAATVLVGHIFHRLIERRFWNPALSGSPPKSDLASRKPMRTSA